MNKKIIIRKIEINDLPALYRLIPKLWIEQDYIPTNDLWIKTSAEFLKNNLDKTVVGFVAIDPKFPHELVSCGFGVIWNQLPSFWNVSGKCGFCQWFYTDKKYRGNKLGERIMNDIMKWFAENNIKLVQLNATKSAVSFYERFGFKPNDNWPQMQWNG